MEFRTDVTLGMGSPLDPPLFNGGGCLKYHDRDFEDCSRSLAGAILAGSYTVARRDGNPGEVFYIDAWGNGYNALGMPNPGKPYLEEHLPEMCTVAHCAGKKMVVSVAGFTASDYGGLAKTAFDGGADAVELNLGCPNVLTEDGSREPPASYNPEFLDSILQSVALRIGPTPRAVWVKVSPNPVASMIKDLADIVASFPFVKAVTKMNTWPEGYVVDPVTGKSRITVGYAGISGTFLRSMGPAQVEKWRNALPDRVSIIAAGGISSGRDILLYQERGAAAFQVVTGLFRPDTYKLDFGRLERIAAEYVDL